MRSGIIQRLLIVPFCILFCSSIAYSKTSSASTYHSIAQEECPTVAKGKLVKKVDNFMVIFDPSASMTETYLASDECISCHPGYAAEDYAEDHAVSHGGREFAQKNAYPNQGLYLTNHEWINNGSTNQATDFNRKRCAECHQDYLYSKFNFAKDLTKCFNQTIPDLEINSALRLFGSPVYTMRSYGPEKYTKKELDHQLRKILGADGASPLDMTLKAAGKDWFNSTGKIAVIVVSDGKDMDEKEVLAAEELKARYNERICIYTVLIGSDQNGKKVMRKIAQAGQCGLIVNGDTLLDKDEMAAFTKEIFLTEAEPVVQEPVVEAPPLDSDEDGVIDDQDDCPDTRPGLKVDKNGCWKLVIAADVLFDFDKFVFKPEGIKAMNRVVDFMEKYPFLDVSISGHTDNFGSMKYNIALSKRRAMAGLNYLVKNGIEIERLSVSWHSFSVPRATNETIAGRALNRRLEFKFSKQQSPL